MAEYNQSHEMPGVLVPVPGQADDEFPNGITKLMMAAYKGDASMALELVSATPDLVNVKNNQNGTALDYAVAGKQTKVIDILLGFGADLNALDTEGNNLLHKSVLTKDLQRVKFCVELGAHLDCPNKSGDTALIIAAQNNLTDISLYLITMECDINIVNTAGINAREYAFSHNNSEIQTQIERKYHETKNMNVHGGMLLGNECCRRNIGGVRQILRTYGNSALEFGDVRPLQQVCQNGDRDIASLLISHGASLHATSMIGYTPLTCAAIAGYVDIVKLLLSKGSRIHHRNAYGRTPLHNCTIEGHISVVKTLVENGIMLNVKTFDGQTALAIAVYRGHTEIVQYLLEQGACVDVRDNHLDTPLISAAKRGNTECARYLLNHNANVNLVDRQGASPLMIAVATNNQDLVQVLLEHNADVNPANGVGNAVLTMTITSHSTDIAPISEHIRGTYTVERTRSIGIFRKQSKKCTPEENLFIICEKGVESTTDLQHLRDQGADINSKDKYDRTPLMVSIMYSHQHIVQWFVENGAHLDITDSAGRTALMYAVEKGDIVSVQILVNSNADTGIKDNLCRDVFKIAEETGRYHILNLLEYYKSAERRLFHAIKHLQVDKCKELIKKGVDINYLDEYGNRALDYCLHHPASHEVTEIVTLLCKNGINLEKTGQKGPTAIEECLHLRNIEIAKVLLEHSACINKLQPGSLIEACISKDNSFLELFINHAHEQNCVLPFVERALQFLISNQSDDIFDLLCQLPCDTCNLWTNQKFWRECRQAIISDTIRDKLTSLPIVPKQQYVGKCELLNEAGAMSMRLVFDSFFRVHDASSKPDIVEALVRLALDQGHYEIVISLCDSRVIIIG